MHVDRALRRAGGPARVGDEQRVLGIQVRGLEPVRVATRGARPTGGRVRGPTARPFGPARSTTITCSTDRRGHRLVRRLLHRDDLAAPREAVGRDQHLRLARPRAAPRPRRRRTRRRSAARSRRASSTPSPRRRPPAIIGRKMPTASSARTPSDGEPVREPVRGLAQLAVRDARGPCPPRPPTRSAAASGVRSAHRSTQLCARFTDPPPNQVAHSTPREVSRTRGIGLEELEAEVADRGVPEPLDVRGRALDQLLLGRDAVGAHEPGDVRPLHDLGRGSPHDRHGLPRFLSGPTGTLCCTGTAPFPNPAYDPGRQEEPHDADRRRPRPEAVRRASARSAGVPGRDRDGLARS